jgi:hypothetical protein
MGIRLFHEAEVGVDPPHAWGDLLRCHKGINSVMTLTIRLPAAIIIMEIRDLDRVVGGQIHIG